MPVPATHHVNGAPLEPPFPDGLEQATVRPRLLLGRRAKFWQLPGVYTTAVGYAAGHTPNPTYREVCSGHDRTLRGRAGRVRSASGSRYADLLKMFWESHDPTQGMRQGNDVGTQYRSGIYYYDEGQRVAAERTRDAYQRALTTSGYGAITTEILPAPEFYYAEDYHQQYLVEES